LLIEKGKEEKVKQNPHVNRIIKPEVDYSERERIEEYYNFFSINPNKNSRPNTCIFNIIMDENPDELIGEFDTDLDESDINNNNKQ
jgi:hypothetical protein